MSGQFSDKDDMDSLWRALTGTDQGGRDGRAMPGGNAREPAERKRVRRQAAAFSMVYLHVEDERLKEMLDAIDDPLDSGYRAWQLVMQECGDQSPPGKQRLVSQRTFTERGTLASHMEAARVVHALIRFFACIPYAIAMARFMAMYSPSLVVSLNGVTDQWCGLRVSRKPPRNLHAKWNWWESIQ